MCQRTKVDHWTPIWEWMAGPSTMTTLYWDEKGEVIEVSCSTSLAVCLHNKFYIPCPHLAIQLSLCARTCRLGWTCRKKAWGKVTQRCVWGVVSIVCHDSSAPKWIPKDKMQCAREYSKLSFPTRMQNSIYDDLMIPQCDFSTRVATLRDVKGFMMKPNELRDSKVPGEWQIED